MGSFDQNSVPEAALADLVAQAAGFFVAAPYPLRIITRTEPVALTGPIQRLTDRMAQAPRAFWPALDSEQIYLEWAQQNLTLRTLRSHLVVWSGGVFDPGALAGLARERFGVATAVVDQLPPLFTGKYTEEADHLAPVGGFDERPLLRLLLAYQMRGEWNPRTLRALLRMGYAFTLVQDVLTPPPGTADGEMERAQQTLNVQVDVAAGQGDRDTRGETAKAHCTRATLEVQAGQRLHRVAHLLVLQADTLDQLNKTTQTVVAELAAVLPLRVEIGRQAALLQYGTAQPTRLLPTVPHWPVLTQGVAVELPFGVRSEAAGGAQGPFLGRDEAGFLVPARPWTKPGTTDPESRDMLVTGEKGQGKTVFVLKGALAEATYNDVQVVMFEPQRHSRRLVRAVGDKAQDPAGQGLFHDINFATAQINLLDVVEPNLVDQISQVRSLLEALMTAEKVQRDIAGQGMFTPQELGALGQALTEEYGPRWQSLTPTTTPLLHDLCARLGKLNAGRKLARDLQATFVDSAGGAVFDRPTNLPLQLDEARVLAFSVFDIQDRYRPFINGLFTGAVRRRTRRKPRRQKLLVIIDEFGYLVQEPLLMEAVAREMKTCRTFFTGYWLVEQSIRTFDEAGWGKKIADIVSDQIYFRQIGTAPEIAKRLNEEFTDEHLAMMRRATTGWAVARLGEGGEIYHLHADLTGYERRMLGGS